MDLIPDASIAMKRRRVEPARSYRQAGSAEWQLHRDLATQSAAVAFADVPVGGFTFALTKRGMGALDVIVRLIDLAGPPAALWVSTWTVASAECRRLAGLLQSGKVSPLRLLTDGSLLRREPWFAAAVNELFGAGAIRYAPCHLKAAVVRGASRTLTMLGSGNLNACVRVEGFLVADDTGLADFITSTIDEWFGLMPPVSDRAGLRAANEVFGRWREGDVASRGRRRRASAGVDFRGDGLLDHDVRRVGISSF